MIYILIGIFLLIFVFYYSVTRSFNSPFSLLLISFLMALTIITLNMENWQVKIDARLPVYIFTAVGSFAVGCFFSNLLVDRVRIGAGSCCVLPASSKESKHYSIVFETILPVVFTLIYVLMSIKIGKTSENKGSLLRTLYEASRDNNSNRFVFHQTREIVVAAAEVAVLRVLQYIYIHKAKVPKTLVLPFICFLVVVVFSTDRNIFLRFAIYALCLWIFFKTSTSVKPVQTTNIQIIKKTVLFLVVVIGLFYLLGKIKSYTSNLERMIGLYGGSGLYNFNHCLDRIVSEPLRYGKETFSQLISTLKVFGLDLGDGISNVNEFGMVIMYAPNGYVYASNIYSAMASYVVDFGLLGVVFFPLIMGFVFQRLYASALKRGSLYYWGLYSMLVYGVVYFTILEQFFMRFHLGMVYEIGWFSVLYFMAFGSGKLKVTLDVP